MADKTVIVEIQYDKEQAEKDLNDFTSKANKKVGELTDEVFELTEANKRLGKQIKEIEKAGNKDIETKKKLNREIQINRDRIKSANKERTAAIKSITGEKSAFDKLTDSINENTKGQEKLKDSLEQLPGAAGNVVTGFKAMTKAAWAFVANPIGAVIAAIVGAVTLLVKGLKRTEEGTNKLNKIMATFKGVLNAVMGIVSRLSNNLIDAFRSPQDAVKKLWEVIKTNIVNRFTGLVDQFKAFGKLLKSVFTLDTEGIKQSAKEFGESWLQVITGVDNLTGKLKDSFNKLNGEIKEGIDIAREYADAQAELQKAQRLANKIQLDYQLQAEKLRQIRDDEALLLDHRIDANEDLNRTLQEQLKTELAIANQALKVAELRIKAEGESTEALDQRAEALTRISDIQERIAGQESEYLMNVNSLRREKAELEKAELERMRQLSETELEITQETNELLDEIDQEYYEQQQEKENERYALELEKRMQEVNGHKAQQQAILDITTEYLNNSLNIFGATENEKLAIAQKVGNSILALEQKVLDGQKIKAHDYLNISKGIANDVFANKVQKGQEELDYWNNFYNEQLAFFEGNEQAQDEIRRRQKRRQYQYELKQFRLEKTAAIINIAIQGAIAVSKAIAASPLTGGLPFSAIVGGLTIAQGAIVANKKPPEKPNFAKGGTIVDGASHAQGGVDVWGSNGQYFGNVQGKEAMFVMNKNATAEIAAYSQINENHGGRSLKNAKTGKFQDGGQMDSVNIGEEIRAALENVPIVVKVGDIETGLTERQNVKNSAVIG